ncbi:hypothetical protein BTVI_03130 [Pitangus sulphuratus]|nr:hypothetical protein BTVI_03130 [Pitangus sulphuratus]
MDSGKRKPMLQEHPSFQKGLLSKQTDAETHPRLSDELLVSFKEEELGQWVMDLPQRMWDGGNKVEAISSPFIIDVGTMKFATAYFENPLCPW